MTLAHRLSSFLVVGLLLAGTASADSGGPGPWRVLLVYSYGRDFQPHATVAAEFRRQLAAHAARPLEFHEVSVDTARLPRSNAQEDAALTQFLLKRFADDAPNLVVTIGAPAGRFVLNNRAVLFPDVPLLVGGIEARMLEGIPPLGPHDVVVSGRFDRRGVLDTILALRPGTRHIMVVYGASANERRWQEIVEDEFRSYDERIEFIWTTGLSIGEMRAKAAALPPESAILYGNLAVDAAGVPFEADAGLAQLHEVANAPIFGLDETKLGRGIVGGRLVSLTELGREVATTALQLLAGVDPASIPRREVAATHYRFDWRELDRWHISESALPPGSDVRYRPATLWQQHTGVIVSGLLIILFQAILIIIVAVQSRRREKAEHEAHDLNQRILSATEDEKRRLARELHDDFSHRLARLSLDAALLDGSLAPGDGPRIMSGMREQIARLSEDMHALSHQLHPSILEDLGLAEALRTEGDLVARIASLKVIVNVDGVPRHLPPEVSLCAFRIAQEALQNISRHAQATDVNIAVSARNGKLRMTVRDNGVGFEPEQRRKCASLGLASMRERVRLLAGDVKVHSRPGQGTTIETSIPLRAGAS